MRRCDPLRTMAVPPPTPTHLDEAYQPVDKATGCCELIPEKESLLDEGHAVVVAALRYRGSAHVGSRRGRSEAEECLRTLDHVRTRRRPI